MEGWKAWLRNTPILFAVPLIALGTPALRAEMLHSSSPVKEMFPTYCVAKPAARVDAKVVFRSLRAEWEVLRSDLQRAAVETMATMFFIRGGTPPPPPKTKSPTPPGQQGNNPPPPPPPPPPPSGSGEPGTTDPPPDDPPQRTPEPASIVIALLGGGLTSWLAWRRKRNRRNPSASRAA